MKGADAAIEAGARAWHEHIQSQRKDAGRLSDDGHPWRWEHLIESDQRAYRALARTVVIPALAVFVALGRNGHGPGVALECNAPSPHGARG